MKRNVRSSLEIIKRRQNSIQNKTHNRAKLTWEDVNLIRELYENHRTSIADLARRFNIHWNTAQAIVKYKSWNQTY